MSKFSTIHVFGYGETQIIGSDLNFKTATTGLSKATAFVDYVKSQRPADVAEDDYHVIHVFHGNRVSYLSKERGNNFSINWADLDATTLDELSTELISLIPTDPA